jgi:ubiquinone/menaquinone biosynthesis C-methylase UbiE
MKTGSSYETYDRTHIDYDKTRLAVGSEQIVRFLDDTYATGKPRILDAGCGTGSLLAALLAAGYTSLTGIDASVTGLALAAQKLNGTATLACADFRNLPLADATFDVVIFSYSLHHLPSHDREQLESNTTLALNEARRVLKPGGHIIILTCSEEQMSADRGCMWYYKYFPQAAATLAARFLPEECLRTILHNGGTAPEGITVEAVETTRWTDASLDPKGPLDMAWRSGDSLFALCEKTPHLFHQQLLALEADIESGAVLTHIEAVRQRTEVIKQGILLFARTAL